MELFQARPGTLWCGLTQFIGNLSLSVSRCLFLSVSLALIPYNGRKYLSSSSSCWTFLCGTVVWMCRERREGGREGGKYVSHRLGELAVVLEEEEEGQ